MKREDESPRDTLVSAVNSGVLGPRLAGIWQEGGQLVIAVTESPAEVRLRLREIAPHEDVQVKLATYSRAELEELCDVVWTEAERIGAPISAVDVDEMANCALVMLADLDANPSRELRERFAEKPIRWEQGQIVPC